MPPTFFLRLRELTMRKRHPDTFIRSYDDDEETEKTSFQRERQELLMCNLDSFVCCVDKHLQKRTGVIDVS